MRRIGSEPATRITRQAAAMMLALAIALPLAACGSDSPPPLTGNLVDARGGHAGTFRSPDAATPDDDGNDSNAASPANSQEAPR